MGWISSIFAVEKAVDNVLDKEKGLLTQFGGWIGGMDLTPEEVMESNAQTVANVQEFVKSTLSESTGRSRARRSIAQHWIRLQAFMVLLTAIAIPFDAAIAKAYFELATSTLMISVTTSITIFFFGSYGLARLNETKAPK